MTDLEKAARMALEALKQIDEAMPFPVAKFAQADLHQALSNSVEQPAQQKYQSTADKCELTPVPAKGGLLPAQQQEWRGPVDWEEVAADYAKTIAMMKSEMQQQQVDDDRVMTVVYRNVQKEDAQSFMDHPKAVWFGWCHAPYQRDDARYKLEKAVTSPQRKPWVGLTDEEKSDLWCESTGRDCVNEDTHVFADAIEAKLKEKNIK
jgi:hypothetical protein